MSILHLLYTWCTFLYYFRYYALGAHFYTSYVTLYFGIRFYTSSVTHYLTFVSILLLLLCTWCTFLYFCYSMLGSQFYSSVILYYFYTSFVSFLLCEIYYVQSLRISINFCTILTHWDPRLVSINFKNLKMEIDEVKTAWGSTSGTEKDTDCYNCVTA